jgi:hypothetical protein
VEKHIDPKLMIFILHEGLRGRSVAEICREYDISEEQYYEWRQRLIILQPQTTFIGGPLEKPALYEN